MFLWYYRIHKLSKFSVPVNKSSDYQKRTIMKLCFDGFIVKNQRLTPIWTPVFDILMDLQSPTQVSNIEPPKPPKGSKSLAVATVQSWKSGGRGGIRTRGTSKGSHAFQAGPFDHSGTLPKLRFIV